MKKINNTLKEIIDVILYDNPSTQDEIAEQLGISRRYVAKLINPLINEGIIKRAYILDLKKYGEFSSTFDGNITSQDHSASFLIKGMLRTMEEHVIKQLNKAFDALIENNKEKAEESMEMDYTTNNMFEKVRSSVETVISIDPHSQFSKTLSFNEVAYDLERIGDYSIHISKFVINEQYKVNEEIIVFLKEMYKLAIKMLSYSMDSFLNGKPELKDEVMDFEAKLHLSQKKALNCVATEMAENSFDDKDRSNYYIYLSRLIKSLKRIGDISVEIVDTSREFHKNIPRPTTPRSFRNLKE